MKLPSLVFALASRGSSGAVMLALDKPVEEVRLELERGWIHAIARLAATAQRPEDQLRGLLERPARAPAAWLPDDPPSKRGRVTPFHPAVVVRNHVEGQLGDAQAGLRARAGAGRVRLLYPPHASCLGADERPVVALLGAPRTVAELDAAGVTRPPRIDRLLVFLEAVGALVLEAEGPSPYELLGVAVGADEAEVRRTFKRLARALHPDLHPGASDEERRRLEERFAALTAAYRQLLPE